MAIRKGKTAPVKAAGRKLSGRFARFRKIVVFAAVFLLGGLVFNLDRAGNAGVVLLKYKYLIPYPLSRLLPGAGAADGPALPDQKLYGRIIDVSDGDTATLLDDKKNCKYRIRFFGIDAPESTQDYGRSSRNALQDKILGQEVAINVLAVDNYGRAVGKVMLGSRYINLEMVSDGHAWYYPDYAKNEYELAAAEKDARLHKKGLWQANAPQPPWNYRRQNRNKK